MVSAARLTILTVALSALVSCDEAPSRRRSGGGISLPRVVSTDPAAGAGGVPVDTTIEVTFSEAMEASSGTLTLVPDVAFGVSWIREGLAIVIDPGPALPLQSVVTVRVSADFQATLTGRRLASRYEFSFTTQGDCRLDATPPAMTSAAHVSLTAGTTRTTYDLSFDEPVTGLTTEALQLDAIQGSGHGRIASLEANPGNTRFALGLEDLADGEVYHLVVDDRVGDACLNTLPAPVVIRLTVGDACTADVAAPLVTSASSFALPTHTTAATYTLSFDEPVTGVDTGSVTLSGTGGGYLAGVYKVAGMSNYEVELAGLGNGDSYNLTMGLGIQDLCGHALAAPVTVAVSVADPCSSDTTAPVQTSASNVTLPALTSTHTHEIVFNEPVLGADTGTVTLSATAGAGAGVITALSLSGDTIIVELGSLANGDVYHLDASTGVSDLCGNSLSGVARTVISVSDPCAGDTTGPDVLTAMEFEIELAEPTLPLEFNEPVINVAGGVTLSPVWGSGTNTGLTVTALNSATYELSFAASDWAAGDRFALRLATSIEDVCGNALPSALDLILDVRACAGDVAAPQVSSPLAQSLQPGSSIYRLIFDEAVTGVTTGAMSLSGTGSGTLTSVTMVDALTYDVALSGLFSGDVYTFALGAAIADLCGHTLVPLEITLTISTSPFTEDFEDGNYDGWVVAAGTYTREVTNTQAAAGSSRSFHLVGGNQANGDGIEYDLGGMAPSSATVWIRTATTHVHSAVLSLGPSPINDTTAVAFYFSEASTIKFGNAVASVEVPYVADQWYEIRTDFDWIAHTIDIYVNGALEHSDYAFGDTGLAGLDKIFVYNWSASSETWWDEIVFTP